MKNYLNQTITIENIINITHFEIMSISIIPYTSAKIFIILFCDQKKGYERCVNLIGADYTAWETDNYLINYIESRILEIYNDN